MNAVVLASKDGKSAVLLKDGSIRNIPKEYKVGETVHVATRQATIVSYVSAAVAAVCVLFAGIFGYNYQIKTPCSYVTLDVNPSIEYELNSRELVVGIEALNSDAEPIVASVLERVDKKTTLDQAINSTLDVLTTNNYLKSDENNVLLFDVVSGNAKKTDKITNTINEIASVNSGDEYHVISSSIEEHKEAVNNNMSAGRYAMMLDDIKSKGEEVNDDSVLTYKSKSVKEMVSKQDETVTAEKTTTTEEVKKIETSTGKDNVNTAKQQTTVTTNSAQSQTQNTAAAAQNNAQSHTSSSEGNEDDKQSTSSSASPDSGPKKVTSEVGKTETASDAVTPSADASADTGSSSDNDSNTEAQSGSDSKASSGSGGNGSGGGSSEHSGGTGTAEPTTPAQPPITDDIGGGEEQPVAPEQPGATEGGETPPADQPAQPTDGGSSEPSGGESGGEAISDSSTSESEPVSASDTSDSGAVEPQQSSAPVEGE